jgi:hypothetical protein
MLIIRNGNADSDTKKPPCFYYFFPHPRSVTNANYLIGTERQET